MSPRTRFFPRTYFWVITLLRFSLAARVGISIFPVEPWDGVLCISEMELSSAFGRLPNQKAASCRRLYQQAAGCRIFPVVYAFINRPPAALRTLDSGPTRRPRLPIIDTLKHLPPIDPLKLPFGCSGDSAFAGHMGPRCCVDARPRRAVSIFRVKTGSVILPRFASIDPKPTTRPHVSATPPAMRKRRRSGASFPALRRGARFVSYQPISPA